MIPHAHPQSTISRVLEHIAEHAATNGNESNIALWQLLDAGSEFDAYYTDSHDHEDLTALIENVTMALLLSPNVTVQVVAGVS
jgi:hypothetical protein